MIDVQSFVVRVWNASPCAHGQPSLRGHITHVLDDRRVPITTFTDIIDFIEGYLADTYVADTYVADRNGPAT